MRFCYAKKKKCNPEDLRNYQFLFLLSHLNKLSTRILLNYAAKQQRGRKRENRRPYNLLKLIQPLHRAGILIDKFTKQHQHRDEDSSQSTSASNILLISLSVATIASDRLSELGAQDNEAGLNLTVSCSNYLQSNRASGNFHHSRRSGGSSIQVIGIEFPLNELAKNAPVKMDKCKKKRYYLLKKCTLTPITK